MGRQGETTRGTRVLRVALVAILALCAAAGIWAGWIYTQIEKYAGQDQAAPADAICVFGAAEYDGRPSPVFRARLDHALDLYRRGLAPLIITLGGTGGDEYTEGLVGAQYLESRGVSEGNIIAETESTSTEESARRVAVIARANGFQKLVIVSDGTHLFRIHAICTAEGLNVLTSPRPEPAQLDASLETQRVTHEILSYMLWRMHMH